MRRTGSCSQYVQEERLTFTGILPSELFIMVFSSSGLLRAVLHYISLLTVAVNIGIVGLSLHSSGMRCAHFLDFIGLNGFGPSPVPGLEVPYFKTRGSKKVYS